MGNFSTCQSRVTQVSPHWRAKYFPEISISDITDSPRTARRISRRIDSFLIRERQALNNIIKLLLLGPAESGKSTLLKQMNFLDDLDRLYAHEYVPTEEDILSSRTVTYGVNELCYTYNNRELRFIDVGGQKSERRKWVSAFDGVNAIIFFAAISEYDQYMAEDTNTNRLIDAIKLFNEIGNNPLFLKASLILFLNKKDLFQLKVKKVSLKVCFPDYKFKQNYKNASEYIIRKFQKQMVNPDRNIYTHLTCAKDRDQMKFVTDSISDMIIANLVKEFGQVDKE